MGLESHDHHTKLTSFDHSLQTLSECQEKLAANDGVEDGVMATGSNVKSPLRAIVHQDEEAMSTQLEEVEARVSCSAIDHLLIFFLRLFFRVCVPNLKQI